jgi:cytochrome P450
MSTCPIAHGYDPLDPSVVADPYPALRQLREEGPLFYLPGLDHYIVTRFDDIEAILKDRVTWSAANASTPLIPVCPEAQEVLNGGFKRVPTLNNADPPRHAPMRKSVLAVMTPRRLRALEPVLRDYAGSLVEGFVGKPVIDFVHEYSFPFPGFAAFSLLGFPDSDTDRLKEWSRTRVLLTYGRLSDEEQVATANDIVAMWRYVEEFVERRTADPLDDLTSDLARLARQQPDQLTTFDIVNIVYSMALAGHETTMNTIGSGILALLRDRKQWQLLIDDPTVIPNAVEEILRFDGPVLNHRRVAKVDTSIGGIEIRAGSRIMMCFAAADHDPTHFGDDAESFRVDRSEAEFHLAFGKGAHLCLGAALGRLETQITLELLTTMTPDMELVSDQELQYSPNALFRGLRSLLVAPHGIAA